MKYMLSVLLFFFVLDCHSDSAGSLNEDGSFKLKETSLKVLGVKFHKLSEPGPWQVPSSSLLNIKFSKGVYRKYDNSITFILVNIIKQDDHKIVISSPDLESGDEVAVDGVTFLRLTEADLKSDTVDACAH